MSMTVPLTERMIRQRIRAELPPALFQRRPLQVLWLPPLLAIIALATTAIIAYPIPWPGKLALAGLIGNIYGSLFFFGHHLLHGSMIKSRLAQDVLMFPCTAILGLSPHLWRVWHHHGHHPFTNVPDHDPDNFGTLSAYRNARFARLFLGIAPGNGHWLRSVLYLMMFFPIHAQGVLWIKAPRRQCFAGLNRLRAVVETVLIYAFWIALAAVAGPYDTIFVVLVPALIANGITLSYIVTQHLLRPFGSGRTTLETTMSVTVPPFIDYVHWFNSHHVEHHLFPTLPYNALPAVRRALVRNYGDRYLAPSYGRALAAVLMTPRLYDGESLVDPATGRRVHLSDVEAVLRGSRDLGTLHPRQASRCSTTTFYGRPSS
jgi:fatty acid desaturase